METSSGPQTSNPATENGYLIALVQVGEITKVFGASPVQSTDGCDQIMEINGMSVGMASNHSNIVHHIHQCISARNICLRVKHGPLKLDNNSATLLDVFVIGKNAHQQLNRFLNLTTLTRNNQDLLKLTDKMEMLELNNAANAVAANVPFNLTQHQQILVSGSNQAHQQLADNQMNMATPHMYRNNPQQQQAIRYMSNPRAPKHRELPVDVPDSFVGIAKQSPRYPPPKPHRQVSPLVPMNNLTSFNHGPASQPQYSQSTANLNQPHPVISPTLTQKMPNTSNTNTLGHNNSLRSSIKLKQLENSRNGQASNYPVGMMQPAVNQAFELNEDNALSSITNNHQAGQQQPHQQQQQQYPNQHQQQALKMKQSMPDLCSILNRLQHNLNGEFVDVSGDAKLLKLLSIYNTIVQTHSKQFTIPNLSTRHTKRTGINGNLEPIILKATDLLQLVINILRDQEMTTDVADLLSILCKHEMEGVCSAFDKIAQSFEFAKSSRPVSPLQKQVQMVSDNNVVQTPVGHLNQAELQASGHKMDDYDYAPDQVQMDIENNLYQHSLHPLTDIDLSGGTCTKTVRVEKSSNQPLGATIKNDENRVVIGRIVCGGAAHKSGLLHEDDEILEVNGVQMRGKSVDEVVNILNGMMGTLTFTVVTRYYNKANSRNLQEKVFVRSFFQYDGENDDFIPCKELGLSFEKGEILAIIDQTDPKWWQAHREGDSEWLLAGLIPSISYLKQRERAVDHDEDIATLYSKHEKKNLVSLLFNCPKGSSARQRKKHTSIPYGPDEIPYYEEVCLYYPIKYRKRPIILVGPKMIGQREIVAKLLQDSNRFASAISHTSKPMQEHERNGIDFHFVTRAQFEEDIKLGKFIECGQYQNQYYGTSLEAMKEVVRSKKTCIHLVNTPSIFNFRNSRAGSELKPFFVFVKPDDSHPEKLRNIVSSFSQPKSDLDENIKAIMAEVQMIEAHYLPYFDLVITVTDIERAYQELLFEIEKIESEPQWIPMFWKESPSS